MFQSYSDEEDYLGLGLRDGRLRLVWNLGWYSRSEVITSNKYNDGQWHTVLIERYLSFLITGAFHYIRTLNTDLIWCMSSYFHKMDISAKKTKLNTKSIVGIQRETKVEGQKL